MNKLRWIIPTTLVLLFVYGPAARAAALDGAAIEGLVAGNTTACRKEKDQSTCTNFFGADGAFTRRMHDDDARRDGRWFIDDADRLCILWDGKTKPLCFVVTENPDGTYALTRHDRHVSSILEVFEGNTEGL